MKYDPELEELMLDVLVKMLGEVPPEGVCRRLAHKAHDFYTEVGMGVEINAD